MERIYVTPDDLAVVRTLVRIEPAAKTYSDARRMCAQGAVWWEGTTLHIAGRRKYENAHLLIDALGDLDC